MSSVATSESTARVRYGEGQPVVLSDLQAEQQYLIAARRRHNLAQHKWGIVQGLALEDHYGSILVEPGYAVDGYGRELILSQEILIPPSCLVPLVGDFIAAFLIYSLAGQPICSGSRTMEEALVRLMPGSAVGIGPRQPPGTPVNQPAPGPGDALPDDPSVEWPVFLGVIMRYPLGSNEFKVDPDSAGLRPYAELRGQKIAAASGYTQVNVGVQAAGDNRAFAVSMLDQKGNLTDRLSIDGQDRLAARGSVSVLSVVANQKPARGNLTIQGASPLQTNTQRPGVGGCDQTGASLQPRHWGIEFGTMPMPKVATPWQVYRAVNPPPQNEPNAPPTNELRFEFLDPGKSGDRTANGLAIGFMEPGGFHEALSVDATCTVRVKDLTVKGTLVLGPIQADPSNPLVQALMVSGWIEGMLGNTGQVTEFYSASMTLTLTLPDQGFVNSNIEFTILVTNPSKLDILGVQLSVSGVTASLPDPGPFDVKAGSSVSHMVTFHAGTAGNLSIAVSATGTSAVGAYQVNASAPGNIDIVEHAEIAPVISAPATGTTGSPVAYTVSITNPGKAALNHVNVTETVTADVPPASTDLMLDEVLQAHQTRQFSRHASRSTAGHLQLEIDAIGYGTGHDNAAQKTAAATVSIQAFQFSGTRNVTNDQVNLQIANLSSEDLAVDSVTAKDPPGATVTAFPNPGIIAAGQTQSVVAPRTLPAGVPIDLDVEIRAKRPSGEDITQSGKISV